MKKRDFLKGLVSLPFLGGFASAAKEQVEKGSALGFYTPECSPPHTEAHNLASDLAQSVQDMLRELGVQGCIVSAKWIPNRNDLKGKYWVDIVKLTSAQEWAYSNGYAL